MQGKIHWHYVSRVRFSQWRPDVMSMVLIPKKNAQGSPNVNIPAPLPWSQDEKTKDTHLQRAHSYMGRIGWQTRTNDESKRTSRDYESKHNTHSNTWHPQHSSHTQSHPIKTFSVASHPFSSACSSFPARHRQTPCLRPAMES